MTRRLEARRLSWAGGLVALAALLLTAEVSAAERQVQAQTAWTDPPAQAPAKEGLAELPGVKLWYTDTGGKGEAVVLLHAYTGSYAMWPYQQPVLAKAGYRVIAYSRRGHFKSDPIKPGAPSASEDLRALLDYLGVKKAHLVGTAGGGLVPPDFALAYPDRVLSVTIASSIAGVSDPDWVEIHKRLHPPELLAMPSALREIGPSYRAANPKGVQAWEALEHVAWGGGDVRQPMSKPLTYASFATIKAPVLLMTGDADMTMPPGRMRILVAKAPPGTDLVTVAEAGHSIYWEQPDAFNAILLDFLRRHPAKD